VHFLKAELSIYVYTSSDRLILYYFTSPFVVGIYDAAYKIVNPFYAISTVITPTMFRDLAQSFKQGRLHSVMAKYVFSMAFFTIPLGFFLLFFSKTVIHMLYGPAFEAGGTPLMILGFVITFGFTAGITVLPFSAWNMSREYGNSILWGNIINIILNFVLIPFFGAAGAALSVLAAKLTVNIVSYKYFKDATNYPIIKDFAYFFTAAIIPLAVISIMALIIHNAYMLMMIFIATYLALMFLFYRRYFGIAVSKYQRQEY